MGAMPGFLVGLSLLAMFFITFVSLLWQVMSAIVIGSPKHYLFVFIKDLLIFLLCIAVYFAAIRIQLYYHESHLRVNFEAVAFAVIATQVVFMWYVRRKSRNGPPNKQRQADA